jgi:hypothetical protein
MTRPSFSDSPVNEGAGSPAPTDQTLGARLTESNSGTGYRRFLMVALKKIYGTVLEPRASSERLMSEVQGIHEKSL